MAKTQRDLHTVISAIWRVDPRAAVYGACACARHGISEYLDPDPRFVAVLEALECWMIGEMCISRVRTAAGDLRAFEGSTSTDRLIRQALLYIEWAVTRDNWSDHINSERELLTSADPLCRALVQLRGLAWTEYGSIGDELSTVALDTRWPRTEPTAVQVACAPPHVQVAWDYVTRSGGGESTLSLFELYQARRHGMSLQLGWTRLGESASQVLGRAVAERVTEANLNEVQRLLGHSG